MTAPIPDEHQRTEALDVTRSFIVEAPAGSGKTELLTRRILKLLATVNEPEEVYAITFTKKAAAEMRVRVFDAISATMRGEDTDRARLAAPVLERSIERGWLLEQSPQRLRILTIDALCSMLVQQAPLLSGLGGSPSIASEAGALYLAAARRALEPAIQQAGEATPAGQLLLHFDNNVASVIESIASLLGKREQWLPIALAGRHEQAQRHALECTLRAFLDNRLEALFAAFPAQSLATVSHIGSRCALALGAEAEMLSGFVNFAPGADSGSVPAWRAIGALLLTTGGTWRKTLTKRQGFVMTGSADDKRLVAEHKAALLDVIAELETIDGLNERLSAAASLPEPQLTDDTWAPLRALLSVLLDAAVHLKAEFASANEVDFVEVALQAIASLGGEGAPTDLAMQLDYRVSHLLVDEFQDTSVLQMRLIEALTRGWQSEDGRTVLLVGDPMQSIYRFRASDVGLFLAARIDGIGGIPLKHLRLDCNFRSSPRIVSWVNRCYSTAMPQTNNALDGAARYANAIAVRPEVEDSGVVVHPYLGRDDRAEAIDIADCVTQTWSKDPNESIALLVRGRSHLTEILAEFRARDIPYSAIDIEGLASSPTVVDLRSLTRALSHPGDRLAWLSVLRAPWCGLRLSDLDALVNARPEDPLVSTIQDPPPGLSLSKDGQWKFDRLRQALSPSLELMGRVRLPVLVERAWVALGGPACAPTPAALEDADRYLQLLYELATSAAVLDWPAFDAALDKLKAVPASTAGVQVMTIHRAKGLEFGTVIVAGLGRVPAASDSPAITWASSPHDGNVLIAPHPGISSADHAYYAMIKDIEQARQELEDVRLLYVATTRAKRSLHLYAHAGVIGRPGDFTVRPERDTAPIAKIWSAVESAFEGAMSVTSDQALAEKLSGPRPQPPRRDYLDFLPQSWTRPQAPPGLAGNGLQTTDEQELIEFSWSTESARLIGVLYHRWVQIIAESGLATWTQQRIDDLLPTCLLQLRQLGLPQDLAAAAARSVVDALRRTLASPAGRFVLAPHDRARCEVPLTVMTTNGFRRLIIDRLFEVGGRTIIIDYKTGRHQGSEVSGFLESERARYGSQLAKYVRAVGGNAVAALYLPLAAPEGLLPVSEPSQGFWWQRHSEIPPELIQVLM